MTHEQRQERRVILDEITQNNLPSSFALRRYDEDNLLLEKVEVWWQKADKHYILAQHTRKLEETEDPLDRIYSKSPFEVFGVSHGTTDRDMKRISRRLYRHATKIGGRMCYKHGILGMSGFCDNSSYAQRDRKKPKQGGKIK